MFQPLTPVEFADMLRQDGDLHDIVNTPSGPIVFLTRGTLQYAITPHPEVDGAVSVQVHQHDNAGDAATCHATGVTGMAESVAEFEAMAAQGYLVARSQQSLPTGMYV